MSERKQLGALLVEAGLLTEEGLEAALREQGQTGKSLGRILIDMGLVTESDLVSTLAQQIGLEYVDLAEETIDPAAAVLITPALARRYQALPIRREEDLSAVKDVVEDAPIVKLVNVLITQAVADRASDIHIEPTERDVRVRYRIDGVLHEVMRSPKNIQSGIISRLKIMADINIAERRIPQDGRVSAVIGGRAVDLRVATLPTVHGEKVVMRILDKSTAL